MSETKELQANSVSDSIGGLKKNQIDYTKGVLKNLNDPNFKNAISKADSDYTKNKIYILASNLIKKISDPSIQNKGNLPEWNIIDDFSKGAKSGSLNTLYHLSQNPDRNNFLDKVLATLKNPDGSINYAKLQNEIGNYIDGLNAQKISLQSKIDNMAQNDIDDLNSLLDSAYSGKPNKIQNSVDAKSGDQEFLALKTNQEKIDYLNKMFDGKTCFDLPDNKNFQFLTNVGRLGSIKLSGPKVFLSGPLQTQTVDGKVMLKARVMNVSFNEGSQNSAQGFEINLGELNDIGKNAKDWKMEPSKNEMPYSQIETGEYNSNKIYNQMLAIINMMENQVNGNQSWKAGEKLSYIDYFGAKNILDNGGTLPGFVTKLGKLGIDNGGGLCASANMLYRTLSLGAKTGAVNAFQATQKDEKGNVLAGTRVRKEVPLGSNAPAIFSGLTFSDHSEHYYYVRQDNPIAGDGKNYDATVFVGDSPSSSADLKAINSSGKDLYVHMKISILDSGKPHMYSTDKQGNPLPDNMKGLYDNSTTWFNETYIDDKKPTQAELDHTKQQFANFLSFRPRMPKPKISLPSPNIKN